MIFVHKLAFFYYPYIAIFTFIIASLFRYENSQYKWKSSSSQILHDGLFFWSSNLFHFGMLFLIFGHFFGLLTPIGFYKLLISPEHKQILAMISGGIAGTCCFLGLTLLLYRRLVNSRVYMTSNRSDIFVLLLLYIQLIIGLCSIYFSYQHLEDPSSMIALSNWVKGIFIFDSNIFKYVINEHWIFKLHIFIGTTLFLIFPFTRLIHVFSFPYIYILREGYQIVRKF